MFGITCIFQLVSNLIFLSIFNVDPTCGDIVSHILSVSSFAIHVHVYNVTFTGLFHSVIGAFVTVIVW